MLEKSPFLSEPKPELSTEQLKILTMFRSYFGDPDKEGKLYIPTGTTNFEPTENAPIGKILTKLDARGQDLINQANKLGILSEIMDHRQPDVGDSSESMPSVRPYDSEAGITVIFSDTVIDHLKKK